MGTAAGLRRSQADGTMLSFNRVDTLALRPSGYSAGASGMEIDVVKAPTKTLLELREILGPPNPLLLASMKTPEAIAAYQDQGRQIASASRKMISFLIRSLKIRSSGHP